jgi:hypothetical protein
VKNVSIRTFVALVAIAAFAAACQATPAIQQQEVSLLFSQTAATGRLEPASGDNAYSLVLEGIDAHTVIFADRPVREAGVITTGEFVDGWDEAFGDDPPNAALVEHDRSGVADTIVVRLSNPIYDLTAGTIRYDAVVLADEEHPDRLATVIRRAHGEPPTAFSTVSLFIDSVHSPPGSWMPNCCMPV